MPFQVGNVATHDDGQHTGSAKRGTGLGVKGIDAGLNLTPKTVMADIDAAILNAANGIAGLDANLNLNSSNRLSALAATFSLWTTNPGTEAEITNELTIALTTSGISSGAGGIIDYDLGVSRRHIVGFATDQAGYMIRISDDGATYYQVVVSGRANMQETVIGKFRHVRFQVAASLTYTRVKCIAYRL